MVSPVTVTVNNTFSHSAVVATLTFFSDKQVQAISNSLTALFSSKSNSFDAEVLYFFGVSGVGKWYWCIPGKKQTALLNYSSLLHFRM